MKFIIATKNKKKLAELGRILAPLGIEAVTDDMIGITLSDVEETGKTFEDNARLKAVAACRESGLAAIADDSGLCVDALGGAPGIYSARYGGAHGDDSANNALLLKNMANVPDENRVARFVCVICCVFPDGREITVRGECEGKIAREACGDRGFGYDPLFICDGKCFGTMNADEKDKISHRGKALRLLAKKLPEYISCL